MTQENTHASFSQQVGFEQSQVQPVTTEQIEEYGLSYGKEVKEDPAPAVEKPEELILGKFKSQEELATAYSELQKKLGTSNDPDPTVTETEEGAASTEDGDPGPDPANTNDEDGLPSDEGNVTTEEVVDDPDPDGGGDPDPVTEVRGSVDNAFQALSDAGEMTDEVKEQFARVGISEELVAHYKDLVEFKATAELNEQMGIAGGADGYAAMVEWAGKTLTSEEVTSFDKVIDEGTSADIKLAITNMKARMEQATKRKGSDMVKATSTAPGVSMYENQMQLQKDMDDPRWATDEEYRNKVHTKLSRSKFNK